MLQVRIEQVIVAEPGAVLLYKISNLLKFYHHTIRYAKLQNMLKMPFFPNCTCKNKSARKSTFVA